MSNHKLNVISRTSDNPDPHKPPVLLVHGAWHAAWCWEDNFLDFFANHGFQTHAIDLRGHGASDAVTSMRWNRVSGYVEDVMSVVDTFETPPFVIGHSMGGYIGQHLLRRTDRLSGIGLLATVPSFGVYKTVLQMIMQRPFDFAWANLSLSLYPLVKDPMAAKRMFFDDDLSNETAIDWAGKLTDASYLGFLDMLFLNIPMGRKYDVPTMVVAGGKDKLFAPATQLHTANKLDAAYEVVADASHDIMLSQHWEQAAQHFLRWMNETRNTQNSTLS